MAHLTVRPHAQIAPDVDGIICDTLAQVLPEPAVKAALEGKTFPGKVILVAIGKAAWRMAKAAQNVLGSAIDRGIVITKYGHVEGLLEGISCYEAGHPVSDKNTYAATEAVLATVEGLQPTDTVLFLVSGGGSALFEKPLVDPATVQRVNQELLERGASILEINTIRKRLSQVKGGRFAQLCAPAHVFQVVLSDVIGDRLDTIASGPAAPDQTTTEEALVLLDAYNISLTPKELQAFLQETPKLLNNVKTVIAGGVSTLCQAAAAACANRGYFPIILSISMCGEAKEEGAAFARLALAAQAEGQNKTALITGGETIVHVVGTGLGGRNQEFALAAAEVLAESTDITLLSLGSDGTDGPTDAAGGIVNGSTWQAIAAAGIDPAFALVNNDAYHALQACNHLIITGPTGTNVNDVAIALVTH